MAAPKLCWAKLRSQLWRWASGKVLKPSIVWHAKRRTGASSNRLAFCLSSLSLYASPSLVNSAAQAFTIASDSARFTAGSLRIMNRHGWLLWAEGAQDAASKTCSTSTSGTGLVWSFLMLRRCFMVSKRSGIR